MDSSNRFSLNEISDAQKAEIREWAKQTLGKDVNGHIYTSKDLNQKQRALVSIAFGEQVEKAPLVTEKTVDKLIQGMTSGKDIQQHKKNFVTSTVKHIWGGVFGRIKAEDIDDLVHQRARPIKGFNPTETKVTPSNKKDWILSYEQFCENRKNRGSIGNPETLIREFKNVVKASVNLAAYSGHEEGYLTSGLIDGTRYVRGFDLSRELALRQPEIRRLIDSEKMLHPKTKEKILESHVRTADFLKKMLDFGYITVAVAEEEQRRQGFTNVLETNQHEILDMEYVRKAAAQDPKAMIDTWKKEMNTLAQNVRDAAAKVGLDPDDMEKLKHAIESAETYFNSCCTRFLATNSKFVEAMSRSKF